MTQCFCTACVCLPALNHLGHLQLRSQEVKCVHVYIPTLFSHTHPMMIMICHQNSLHSHPFFAGSNGSQLRLLDILDVVPQNPVECTHVS